MRHLISVDLLRNRLLLLLHAPGILALLRVHLLRLMQLHRVHDHMLLHVIRQIPKSRLQLVMSLTLSVSISDELQVS